LASSCCPVSTTHHAGLPYSGSAPPSGVTQEALCPFLEGEQEQSEDDCLEATALRLTVLEGLSLRAAAAQLQISPMAVQPAQKKALAALRQQLAGGG
jgi:hypothetical protein